MKIRTLFFILIITCSVILPQDESTVKFDFLPAGMNFMPLKANNQEAKLGVLYHTATTNLKVDIGNSIDLFAWNFLSAGSKLTAGIEFMAYALSTSYNGNRLQIDAVDGFFGGNISFTNKLETEADSTPDKLQFRLKIIHNSAHFVDGHFDTRTNSWINNQGPSPYTEDFGELTAAHQLNSKDIAFRYFGGFSYSTLVRPDDLNRYNFHLGFEFALKGLLGTIAGKEGSLFLANFTNTDGQNSYIISQQTMLGIKFGDWDSKGIVLYTAYYSGGDIFGAYYNRRISKFGIGFLVDYP